MTDALDEIKRAGKSADWKREGPERLFWYIHHTQE